jgi:hypothetical protein
MLDEGERPMGDRGTVRASERRDAGMGGIWVRMMVGARCGGAERSGWAGQSRRSCLPDEPIWGDAHLANGARAGRGRGCGCGSRWASRVCLWKMRWRGRDRRAKASGGFKASLAWRAALRARTCFLKAPVNYTARNLHGRGSELARIRHRGGGAVEQSG